MKLYTKCCSQNAQKLSQVGGSSLHLSRFLSFTRHFLFLLPLASLFLLASCGGGGGSNPPASALQSNLSIADATALESAGAIEFTVSLNATSDSATSFYYRTKDDSAVAGSDYRAVAKSASIASGDIDTTISVVIIDDDEIEDEEIFFVEILRSSTADTVIARATATIKIDDLPSLSITGAVASEDAESLEFIASLSAPFPGNDVSFSYQTIADSATQGDDYTGVATKTATIPAGSTQISIPISIVKDDTDEGTEVFELVISKPVNATISQASALGIIKGEIASLFIADDSIPESTGVFKFIVILTRAVNQTVYFEYQTILSSASAPSDYTRASGRASIPAGDTTAEISISIIDDQLVEDDESFFVEISSPTRGIFISRERATVTIRIDDLPNLSVADTSVAEDVGRLQFIASLSSPFPGHIVAFDYETIPSSASRNLDYTHSARRASIKAGELITSIFVDIIDDLDVENDESFDLVISNPSNATIDKNRARATATIEIDDLPILSIANVSAFENAGILKFVASLSEPFGADVSFDYQTRAGSAIPGFDYTSDSGRASILAGDTTTEIPIAIRDDNLVEAAESFDLVISKLVNATISKPSATATIKIDELPILSVTDATALESAGSLQFVASLSEPFPGNIVSFDYETMPSSASRDLDYSHASARATILAGDTTTSILIAITDDALVETAESFDLVIANPTNATIDKNRARATGIIEIDDLPLLSIANVSASEDAGSLIFVARLSESFSADVSFDYETIAGSASSPSDYISVSDRASILAGDTTTEIPISIINDGVNEGDEVFSLELSNPVNATISKASALGIIEGKIASLFIADAAAFESELELRFVVTLSKAVSQNLSFSYRTIAGSATQGDDYTVVAAETVSIPAGETTAEIIIVLIDDEKVEDDETFFVEISSVSSTEVLLSKERATGTIKIDDLPTLSIAGASAIESAGSLGFVVSLSEAFPGNEVSFFYSTLGGSAIARLDYTHFFARASIKADSTSITIPISIIDDVLVEADESFDVIIAQPLNATISTARATGIIEFEDLPSLSVVGSSVIESAGSLRFRVFLSVPIVKDVSFDYETLSGSASATSDYTSAFGTTSIPAGSKEISILIDISDDTLVEADETFDLMITNPANATIDKNRASATATIEIDDLPTLSITGSSVIENAGSIKFLVTLSEPFPGNIVAFDYYTVQGSAIADLDYTHSFASASIKADSTSVSIPISIIDDVLVEPDESFDVIIAQPINATISTARATGIIEFQDLPSLSVVGSSVIESEGSLRFRVFLSVPIMKDVSFDYQTLSGSASATIDYTSVLDTTSIPAGSKEISIFIDLIDDALIEDDETFDLVITNPANATIDKNRARATATIKIDDLPTLSIAGSSVIESAGSIKFLVTLSEPFPGNIVSFDYETIAGSATEVDDYTGVATRSATISAGDTTTAIAIVIRNDRLIEEAETFDLVISNPINATIDKNRARATGRIEIDDLPSLSITGSSVVERAGTLLFTVSLSAPFLSTDVSFDYETIAGSASAGSDYLSTSGRATIKAGSSTVEISVPIINDGVNEGDEVFSLKLSNPVNATISKASALGIIKGEIASLFIADAAAFESELELRFVVTLSKTVNQNLSFSYRTITGSATEGDDYTGVANETVSIQAGETTAEIIIVLSDDAEVEDDETFDVEISSVSSTEVRFSKERATGTIKIEDLPILSIANVTTLENAGSLQFVASLSVPFPGNLVSFDYETLGGSAIAGLDYSYLLTTANIYSGDTTALINIIILDDDLVEDDETFDIIISNLANATIDQLKATATIKIDELPSLSITGSSVVESAGSVKFIVRLSEAFRITDVSFDYKTSAGSASDGADYTGVATRRATISAGDSTTAIFIAIIDDDTTEDYESFDVIISNPTNATIDENRARATATIQIDELPSLSITGSSVIESAGSVKFIVTLSPPFRITDVLFDYKTSAGSASDDLDYTGVDLDTATISAGDSTTAIFIAIIDDELVEADESFDVIISNPTNATIDQNRARATATIKIDDLPLLSIANVSALEDVGSLEFIAILSEPFDGYEISFNYETLSGSASDDADYTGVALDTATISAGDSTTAIFIVINNDELVEDDESFDIIISNLVNATIDKARATATIKIDELPSLSITDATALENAGSMQFIVTLSRAFRSTEVSFFYQTLGSSASDGADYTGVALNTATISAGDSTTAIFIVINNDDLVEDNETFDVIISNLVNATTGDNRATGTIKIDELPTLSIADATSLESAGSVKFIATLNPPFRSTDVSFFYQTLGSSATQGDDYTGVDLGTATIRAGDSTTAIFIVIDNDEIVEEDESFDVIISNPTNATIDENAARATAIIKLDDLPILSIADAKDLESAGSLKFIATLSAAFSRTDVSFYYATIADSASSPSDYISVSDSTSILAGDTTTEISITMIADDTKEGDEFFRVRLSQPVNARIINSTALGTIVGEIPSLSIANATAAENAGQMKFIVTLSKPVTNNIDFSYQTKAGSATDGDDYEGVTLTTVTMLAGATTADIFITIIDDPDIEDDETFDVIISTNEPKDEIAISKKSATGTISIDERPILSIADATALESAESVKFTATLSEAFSRTDVFFDYETLGSSATQGDDYEGVTTQEARILAGDTTTEIFIRIIDDLDVEADESFDVLFSSPVNATLGNTSATARIISDDLPSLSIADAAALESEQKMKFIVSLSAAFSSAAVSFNYKTMAGSATEGDDYKGVALTTATIPAGVTTFEIFIDISDDSLIEDDETFDIIISNPTTNATIGENAARATGTIKLEDLPILYIEDNSAPEDAGSLEFTASLSEAFLKTEVSFNYHTEAGSATATVDYISSSGRAIIPAGERSFTISIKLNDDATNEGREEFYLVISSLNNATIDTTRILGVIINDDLSSLSVADAIGYEREGNVTVEVIVSLSEPVPSDGLVQVSLRTEDGSAKYGIDYSHNFSGAVFIDPLKSKRLFYITIIDDDIIEEDETFDVVFNHVGGATIGRSRATITIKNNDFPVLSVADSYALEDATSIKFTATLAQPWRSTDVYFNYHTEAGSATATDDYTGVTTTDSRRAMIPAGDTTTEIFIAIINDTTVENDETFDIVISNPDNHDVSIRKFHNRATATIIDDELPLLSIADATALEGAGVIEFRLTLSKPDASLTSYGIRILDVVNGVHTAQQTFDFVLPSTNGSIATSDTSGDLLVTIKQDFIVEGNETFRVELISISSNAVIYSTRKIAVGTIIDDDEPLTLSIADATALESAGQMKLTLSLNDVLAERDVDVFWSTRAGSALAGDDYTGFTTQKASILAGKTTTDIFIDLEDDSLSELDESFDVIITSSAPGINITKDTATATIVNDDYPTLSFLEVLEGEESLGRIRFVIVLKDAHKDQVVEVAWRTRDGSALAGVDYTAASGTTFITGTALNLVSDSFAVNILDDSIHESDETFDAIITSNFPGINISNNTATATIIDDDLPRLSVADATALEGEDMQFSVILDVTSSEDISFSYHTEAGSALAGVDYTEVTANSITTASIPAGSTSASIMISTSSDAVVEGDESFFLVLTDPVNATLDSPRATGTIEGLATIHITGGSALEYDQELKFVARLERPLSEEVSFSYYTLAGSAHAGDDYTEVPAAYPLSISIPAGDTATEFSIIIIDDDIVEADETFDVRFISPVNAVLGQEQVTATIIDALPSLSVADATAQEDARVIEFIVTLSSSRINPVSFDYATQSISANVLKFTSFTSNQGSVIWGAHEHASVVFNNYMWSLGGSNSSSSSGFVNVNHAWRLTSGRQGDYSVRSRIKEARNSHSSLVFEEKMWVLGGNTANRIYAGNSYQNDVQHSTGGADPSAWNEVKPNNNAGWQARRSHSSVVFKNKMWVLGGYSKKYLPTDASLRNDVWDSTNGIAWNEVKADSTNDPHSWSARQEHTSVVFDNKMWVLGGSVSGDYNQNDVWDSTNGIAWNEVKTNNNAGWKARYKHTSVVYEGKIWVLGGDSGKYPARYIEGDAWYSIDGVVWNKNTENLDYRAGHTSVVFEDRLWLIGGINSGFLRLAYFEAQRDYISKSARVSIPPGATSKTLTINLINDTVAEPTETFRLIISNPTNAVIDPARSKATGTIQDTD